MHEYGKITLNQNDIYTILIALVAIQDSLNASTLFNPFWGVIKYPLLGGILCLMAYLIFKSRVNIKILIILGIFLLLGLNTARILSINTVLYIVILCFLSRKHNIHKSAKVILYIVGSIFCVHLAIFLFNYIFFRDSVSYLDWNGIARYYLFYDHPNNAAKYFVFISVLIEYVYSSKLRLFHWMCILVVMILVYSFTRSESAFVVVILAIISVCKSKRIMKKLLAFFSQYGMVIFAGISVCTAYSIKIPGLSNLLLILDVMGSGRFSHMYRAVEKYGITLFGQEAIFGNNTIVGGYFGIYADNLTVYCMTCLGVVFIIALCFLFYLSAPKMDTSSRIYVCIFIIVSFFENRLMSIEAYFALIIAVNALTNNSGMRDVLELSKNQST